MFKLFLHLRSLKKASQKAAKIINTGDYDLVYADICRYIMAPYIFRFLKIPSIYFCQNPLREVREPVAYFKGKSRHEKNDNRDKIKSWLNISEKYFLRLIEKKNAENATKILTNSYYTKEYIYHAYGLKADVIHLGVDNKVFYRSCDLPENYILSVGGIQYVKRFHSVIQALGAVPEKKRPKLVVVGNRADCLVKKQLSEDAQKHNVVLEIHENISVEKLRNLYNKAFAVVFVPLMEPFGLVVLEAMACGTPVIGVREGGVREIISDNESGLLVNRNPEEISKAIIRLQEDKGLRDSIINNALIHIKEYWNWQRAAGQLNERFKDLTGNG